MARPILPSQICFLMLWNTLSMAAPPDSLVPDRLIPNVAFATTFAGAVPVRVEEASPLGVVVRPADDFSAKLAEALANSKVLFVMAGDHSISETLEIGPRESVRVVGLAGRPRDVKQRTGSIVRGNSSAARLIWRGEKGGTLLRLNGVNGFVCENIAFVGARRAGDLIRHTTVKGVGSLDLRFSNCGFFLADCLFKNHSETGRGAANITFDNCMFGRARQGFVNVHLQGMIFRFLACHGFALDDWITLEHGGHVRMLACATAHVKRILVRRGGALNQSGIRIDQLKIDAQGHHQCQLYVEEGKGSAWGAVTIDQLTMGHSGNPPTDTPPVMVLRGGSSVVLRDSRLPPSRILGGRLADMQVGAYARGMSCYLFVERLWGLETHAADDLAGNYLRMKNVGQARCWYRFSDCFPWNRGPLMNESNML